MNQTTERDDGDRSHRFLGNVQETLPLLGTLIAANLAVFLIEAVTASSTANTTSSSLVRDGGLYGPAVENGEWWRILTSGFLHASWGHFVSNMVALVFLGVLLGHALGGVRSTLIYLSALLGGAVAVLILDSQDLTVGASGAILGLAGAGIAVAWRQRRWLSLLLLGGWVITNILFTLTTPGISVAGHLGGFVSGALFVRLLFSGEGGQLRSVGVSVALGCLTLPILFVLALAIA